MSLDDIPTGDDRALELARQDARNLAELPTPGFRMERARMRLQMALENGQSGAERERLEELAFGREESPWLRWLQALRESGHAIRLGLAVLSISLVVGVLSLVDKSEPMDLSVSLVAEELGGQPYVLPDGSSFLLDAGARGQLTRSAGQVHFELHHGLVHVDVIPAGGQNWSLTAGDYEVVVVGTRFHVHYLPNELFEVRVDRGEVAVKASHPESHQLKTGEAFQVSLERGAVPSNERDESGHQEQESVSATPATEAPDQQQNESLTNDVGSKGAATPPPETETWRSLYRRGSYSAALAAAQATGLDELIRNLGPEALSELADAARLGGEPAIAERVLGALLGRFPESSQGREAKFLLGRMYALGGQSSRAIATFESYLNQSGAEPYAGEAMGRLMELHSAAGNTSQARSWAKRYLEHSPRGPYQRLAHSLLKQ